MPESHHTLVVIGASAGGLQALAALFTDLPQQTPVCVMVVMHTSSNPSGVLPEIVRRFTDRVATFAKSGDPIEAGRVYLAPPDCHLIIEDGAISVVHGPRENGFRPAIDPLFRTAGREFGRRVIGVILSGALGDGTYGLSVIKHYGGIAIVQEPSDAIIPTMPLSAIKSVDIDYVLPARDIGRAIQDLAGAAPRGGSTMARRNADPEPQSVDANEVETMEQRFGPPSGLTCPDCGGALWEVKEDGVLRYQCHVGHQYAPENLEEGQRDAVDGALWSAVRVLEEHAALKTRMAARATERNMRAVAEGFAEGAREAHEQAQQIRSVLFNLDMTRGASAAAAPERRAARASSAKSVAARGKSSNGRARKRR